MLRVPAAVLADLVRTAIWYPENPGLGTGVQRSTPWLITPWLIFASYVLLGTVGSLINLSFGVVLAVASFCMVTLLKVLLAGPIRSHSIGSSVQQLRAHFAIPLYRNGYALMVSSVGSAGLGLGYWAVAALLYSPHAVGLNSALVAAMMLLSGLGQLSLNSVLVRFLPIAAINAQALVLGCYSAGAVASLLLGAGFLGVVTLWSPSLRVLVDDPALGGMFLLATIAWTIFSLQDSVLTGVRQALWVPLENLTFSALKLLLLVVFTTLSPAYGIFLAWTVPVVLSLLPVNALIWGRYLRRVGRTGGESERLPLSMSARSCHRRASTRVGARRAR